MKNFCSIFAVFLCLVCSFVFVACGQANSVPDATPQASVEFTPAPTPETIDYAALATKLNGDIISPVDEMEEKLSEAEAKEESEILSDMPGSFADSETGDAAPDAPNAESEAEKIQNALISGGIFEAGTDCLIYRFWSAGIDQELIDLLGSDGTESSAIVYSELLKSFIANYAALQKAVALYEPDAVLVLHVVENSEATDPIIMVENGEVTYDYGTAQGYFVSNAPVEDPVEAAG